MQGRNDQPEIIRCKDCLYFRKDGYCTYNNHNILRKEWFCADGERGEDMKVTQTWKRNMPSTLGGESITLKTVYSSFDKQEIDDLEQKMPKGMIVMDSEGMKKKDDDESI